MDACMGLGGIWLLYKGVNSFILLVGMKSVVVEKTEREMIDTINKRGDRCPMGQIGARKKKNEA